MGNLTRISGSLIANYSSSITGTGSFGRLQLDDGNKAVFGSDDDGNIKHTGTNLQIQETTGNLQLINYANDKDISLQTDDGSGGTTAYITLDGSTTKVEVAKDTNFAGNVSGSLTSTGSFGSLNATHLNGILEGTLGPVANALISGSTVVNAPNISGSITSTGSFGSLVVVDKVQGDLDFSGNITAAGDISTSGSIFAREFHTEFTSASVVFASGSNKFGDDSEDTHRVTGSLLVSGSITMADGDLSVTDNLDVDGTTNLDVVDIDGAVDMASTLAVADVLTVAKSVSAGSAAKDTPFLTLSATDAGVNMSGGEGASILFKIPDDETNPSVGASISGIKENADDSLSQTALSFNVSQNDETLDEALRITSAGLVGIGDTAPSAPLEVSRDNSAQGSFGYNGVMIAASSQSATTYTGSSASTWGPRLSISHEDTNATRTAATLQFVHRSGSSGVAAIASTNAAADRGDLRFITRGSGNVVGERMIINQDGNVGIGTDGPDSKFHVYMAADSEVYWGQDAAGVFQSVGTNQHYRFLYDNGGSEAMRIEDGGNVGIGTTNPDRLLHVNGAGGGQALAVFEDTSANANILIQAPGSDKNSILNFGDAGSTEIGQVDYDHANNSMRFVTNANERMRIDISGSIGINDNDPVSNSGFGHPFLKMKGATFPAFIIHNTAGGAEALMANASGSGMQFAIAGNGVAADNNIRFRTSNANSNYNSTERMRITSGGDVGIGETSPLNKFYVVETESKAVATFYNTRNPSSSPPHCLDLNFAYTPDNTTSYFVRGQDNLGAGSAVSEFHIYSDGSFVQSSDRRMKENIVDSENQLDKINQLKVRDYNKINDSSKKKHIGFIAQELQEVFPHLVIEAEDEAKTLQIYKVGIVPLLVKAVQELSAKVEALENA